MQFVLIVTNKTSGTSTRCDLALDEPVVLGRHMESPVALLGEGLSRRHFMLSLKEGTLFIQDLSSNGTWLNGIQLRSQTIVRVRPSDLLEVPGYEVRIAHSLPLQTEDPSGIGEKPDRTNPSSRWAKASQAVTKIFEPRELLLIGCILATIVLLGYAFIN